ncbi:hypothetical protein [Marinococcus halotolerans]|uniref:hypothetical protein n=1 Tax=Marinococcus halotolerans TaxID=301092 RepID=UPI0003B40A24|nr:hypothetical protein [Marinococcus halotolerans]
MKPRIHQALHKLDKHANDNISESLLQGQPALMYLNGKQEQKLQDIFYFLRVENLVHMESVGEYDSLSSPTSHVVRAIPLPKLVHILHDQEAE